MKHILLSTALLFAAVVTALAQEAPAKSYEAYYTNLPIEIEQVKPVVFPETKVNLGKYLQQFNIKPGSTDLVTEALQTAINDLAAQGGGHLIIPRGTWKTGPIELKSNIDLHLNRGATLLFSEDKSLYVQPDKKGRVPDKAVPCITAKKCENIGITGQGVIDGQGFFWRPIKKQKVVYKGTEEEKLVWEQAKALGGYIYPAEDPNNPKEDKKAVWYPFNLKKELGIPNIASNADAQEKMRYHLVSIQDCKNVLIEDVTLRNSPKFHLVPARCQNLIIDNITIDCPWWAQNGDAMDIGNTQVCLVVNCKVSAGDDGICMKGGVGQSGVERGPNRDFLIRNDTVFRAHGGFVIGSEFSGGMQRMVVKDCLFDGTDIGLRFKSAPGRGGWCEDIYCEDIVMRNIREDAIFFESGYADKAVGRSATDSDDKSAFFPDWANFVFRNITCVNPRTAINITGLKGKPVHDLVFDHIMFIGVINDQMKISCAENLTFTNCSFTGSTDRKIDSKTCKAITLDGKEITK